MTPETLTQNNKKIQLIVILGPTASGKTDLAIKLAKKFNGEIVCADSRQIYTEMIIGTASPSQMKNEKRKTKNHKEKSKKINAIKHHLFGIIKPNQTFNVSNYQKLAIKAIKDIQKRGKIPFLVGGTAFYIYSVVEGWQFPKLKANLALRKKLETQSPAQLFEVLKKLDKARAKNIDENNKRRLIRAIEMAKQFGQVPAITKKPPFDCLVLGTKINQKELKKRVEERTNKMLKQGLEKEVKALVKKYGWTPILRNTIGYSEWKEFWKEPSSFDPRRNSVPSIVLHTMQFAKRQMTWFKRDKKIRWIKNHEQAATLIKKFTRDSSPAGSE